MIVDQRQQSTTTQSEVAEQAEAYDDEELQEEGFAEGHRFLFFNAVPSWLVSMVVHVVIVLTMALIPVRASMERRGR